MNVPLEETYNVEIQSVDAVNEQLTTWEFQVETDSCQVMLGEIEVSDKVMKLATLELSWPDGQEVDMGTVDKMALAHSIRKAYRQYQEGQ